MCFVTFVSKHWKNENNVGRFDKESNITEKKIPVSTRTPEDITIKYLRCISRGAKKATISFVVSACQFARPHETTFSQLTDVCDMLYWVVLQFSWENLIWVKIGQNYEALCLPSFTATRRNAVRYNYIQHICARPQYHKQWAFVA